MISVKGKVKPLSFDHKPDDKGKSGLLRPEQSSYNTFSAEKARIYAAGGYIEDGRVHVDDGHENS